jgi:alkanesulfonate monooxygenase SsuD/methylene tetrahydromethanopterin reductase-like flavin-dependent oxidoreductase (luciferase family)
MKISLFIEHGIPRPWDRDTERKAFNDALELAELADKVGVHELWVTEHHFLEEYSHSSAPEVWLGAATQRTQRIRLGHGIMQLPPQINHPLRAAERVATLDLLSGGRLDFGTGEASSTAELGGFVVDPATKRAAWTEGLTTIVRAMTEEPFTGVDGQFVQAPPRNVVPKPYQHPHPPLWVACTRSDTVRFAATQGIGALSFSLKGPETFGEIVANYYQTLEEAVPIGKAVNADTVAYLGDLLIADTEGQARKKIGIGEGWLGYGISYYYVQGRHHPGRDSLFELFKAYKEGEIAKAEQLAAELEAGRSARPDWEEVAAASKIASAGVGSPAQLIETLASFEQVGADQVMFSLPAVDHEANMETVAALAKVLPQFIERDEKFVQAKTERLAPVIDKVMARRVDTAPKLDPDYTFGGIPVGFDRKYKADEVVESLEV